MSILDKARQFFDLKEKRQQKRIDTLRKIIKQLDAKAKGLKKRLEEESERDRHDKMVEKYAAVKKLLAKSRRRLVRLKALKRSS